MTWVVVWAGAERARAAATSLALATRGGFFVTARVRGDDVLAPAAEDKPILAFSRQQGRRAGHRCGTSAQAAARAERARMEISSLAVVAQSGVPAQAASAAATTEYLAVTATVFLSKGSSLFVIELDLVLVITIDNCYL